MRRITHLLVPVAGRMCHLVIMRWIFVILSGFFLFAKGGMAASPTMRVGAWHTVPDVQLRLLLVEEGAAGLVRGGVEMRLAPGFKTYWKNPGDSGVPPQFDFSASRGINNVIVLYPLPRLLDDKAGGFLIGYEERVIFPFEAMRDLQTPLAVHVKLDFAICGTMCIPLTAQLSLDKMPENLEPANELRAAFAHAPKPEAGRMQPSDVKVIRLAKGTKPIWQVRVPFKAETGQMRAFAEGRSFLTVSAISFESPGFAVVTLEGYAQPSADEARFNPARLTFGIEGMARDIPLDLDGARILP